MSEEMTKDSEEKAIKALEKSRRALLNILDDLKEEKERAEESEEKYRKQFERAMDAIFVADAETGILIDCNRAASELVGREKSELVGKHQRILHPPEEIEGEFSRTFKQHLKEKEGQVLEAQVITKKGEIREVAIKANLFELRGKKVLQGIFRDITERKKAEKAIKASEEKYRTLTENINVGIYRNTPGPKGKFIEANPAIVKMFGYDKEDFLKFNVSDLYQNPEDRKKFSEKIMKDGFVRNEEIRLKKKDGTPIWGSVTAVAVRDEKGTTKYYDGIIDGITKRKEMEEELKKSYEETKMALERERNFIEETAHHFRNPILIASGYLEIELEKELSEEDRKNIEGIKRAVERLNRTVENVITRGEIHG